MLLWLYMKNQSSELSQEPAFLTSSFESKGISWRLHSYNPHSSKAKFYSIGFNNQVVVYPTLACDGSNGDLIDHFPEGAEVLVKMFGWQGGTIHQVIAEIKKYAPKIN